ncbi:glycosyltransferase [uncultured Alteromonas sp.]|uniref:glycosyltransferase n=1 Tax=uncultured Alteromonas sp. TaxID=179113 RepID=UPI0030DA0A9B
MSDTKQVCFFVRSFPVLSETFVVNQVKDLVAEGVDVHVLAVNPIKANDEVSTGIFGTEATVKVTSILPTLHGKISYLYMLLGLIICFFSPKRFALINLFFHFLSKKNKFLAKDLMCIVWFLKSRDIDINNCIAHFGNNGVIFDYLIKTDLVKCKNLFTIFHGYEISRYDQLAIWEELYGKMGGKLLPISDHWKRKLESLGVAQSQIEVVHMGVDVNRFAYSEKPVSNPFSILSVARATEKKGLFYAIEAVLMCPLECTYTIIGDGVLLPELKKKVAGHSNGHRVVFMGAQSSNFVAKSLKNSDLFLLPSIKDSSGDMEGIPVSLMEAMASGVVVLSTFHSGIPELITDGESGFLVPEENSLAISNKIVEIHENDNLNEIRRCARIKVDDDFNATKLQARLLKILKF